MVKRRWSSCNPRKCGCVCFIYTVHIYTRSVSSGEEMWQLQFLLLCHAHVIVFRNILSAVAMWLLQYVFVIYSCICYRGRKCGLSNFFFIIYSCHTYAVVIRSVLFGRKFGCSFFFIYSCHAHVVVIRNVL